MGIKFKSPLALSAHRAIAHSDSAQTLEVKVVTKTAAHPEFGNGSANGYTIDGVEGAYLEFTPGNTYKFDQSDSSNTGHPLRFYEDAAKTTAYTTGVTTSGTPGSTGAYTQIIPTTSTNPILYYQCSAHPLMGSYAKFGTGSLGGEADSAIKILLTVKNVSSGTLTAGTVVRVATTSNPPSGNVLEVDVADNSAASTMPAVGVLIEDITVGSEGDCVAFGRASGFSTSGFTEGDALYVNTSGGFTTTKPTGTALIQRIGQVIKVHASNGSIEVFGAGRANDVPNIPQDQLWLGSSNGVATPTSHTVENISNVTVSSKTDGQALVWDATNSYWKNGDVSGGDGGAVVARQTHSADGSTLAFAIGQSITNENNVFVYIDGVYQEKSTFSVSGSTLTFGTGNEPPNGTTVEIISYAQIQPENASSLILDEFVGTGSQTNFTLSAAPRSENTTFVFIQGVYQEKGTYSVSGNTLAFTTAPQNNFSIEVMSLTTVINVADIGQIENDTFSGDGATTAFTLSLAPANIAHTLVYINGVYQEKSTYSLSGTTLTFSTAPAIGDSVEVESRKTITPQGLTLSNLESDLFTATANQTSFTLVNGSPTAKSQTLVYINGVYQNKSTYSFTSGAIVLSTGATAGDEVEVVSLEGVAAAPLNGVSSVNGQTGDVTVASSKYDVNVISANTNAQAFYVYVFTANLTLTLPAAPEVGQWIKISNRSGVATCVLGRNGNNIMGSASDLTLDTATASFELVYSGAAQGWVIIGQ